VLVVEEERLLQQQLLRKPRGASRCGGARDTKRERERERERERGAEAEAEAVEEDT